MAGTRAHLWQALAKAAASHGPEKYKIERAWKGCSGANEIPWRILGQLGEIRKVFRYWQMKVRDNAIKSGPLM